MKKNLNKLATLALTGMMVAGMSFGAMADTEGDAADQPVASSWSSTAPSLGSGNKVTIKKQIKLVNHPVTGDPENGTDVPDVTYTYAIEAESNPGYIGTEEDHYQVEAGNKNALTTTSASVVFKDRNGTEGMDIAKNGVVTGTFDIGFDATEFSGAGVYRYKITETNPTTSDVSYDKTDDILYLDVYVDAKKEITAYVLLKENGNREGNAMEDAGKKREGYTVVDNGEGTTTAGDVYNTYDLNVKKCIEGNDSIKNLTFKFDVTLVKNNNGVDNVVDSWTGKKNNTDSASDAKKVGVTAEEETGNGYGTVFYNLSNGGVIEIKNVPASATFTVKETNSSVNTFVVSAGGATLSGLTGGATTVTMAQNASAETTSTSFITNDTAKAKTVTLTNTYSSTPVTGVAMNIAPYAAMVLGAGAFAGIFLGGKRRKAEDED